MINYEVMEYFVAEGDDNPKAFEGIEAMMRFYTANKEELKILELNLLRSSLAQPPKRTLLQPLREHPKSSTIPVQ